jgi:hypothetical protein
MANFRTHTEAPAEEAVIANDCATNARPNGQHCHVRKETSRTKAILGPSRSVCVVLDGRGEPDPVLNALADGLITPGQIGRVVNHRLRGINESRGCNADGKHRMVTAQLRDSLRDGMLNRSNIRGWSGDSGLCVDDSLGVHKAGGNLRTADVYTNREHGYLSRT